MHDLALILFGFFLALIPPWLARKGRLRTHWAALRGELQLSNDLAEALLQDGVQAPLYRMPTKAYEVSFPVLLADGAVKEDELTILAKCFGQVEDINRGLDQAAAANLSGNESKLKSEFKRNKKKAKDLIAGDEGVRSLLSEAKAVLDRKLAMQWWRYAR